MRKKKREGLASFWPWGWPKEEVEPMEVCREATRGGPGGPGGKECGESVGKGGKAGGP